MAGGGRLGDKAQITGDAHGCPGCPHPGIGPGISGSADVLINGRPALRVGDAGIHAACCAGNTWKAQKGASTVFINGKAAFRQGDQSLHCGGAGKLAEGSSDVLIGDSGGGGGGGGGGVAGASDGDGDGDGAGSGSGSAAPQSADPMSVAYAAFVTATSATSSASTGKKPGGAVMSLQNRLPSLREFIPFYDGADVRGGTIAAWDGKLLFGWKLDGDHIQNRLLMTVTDRKGVKSAPIELKARGDSKSAEKSSVPFPSGLNAFGEVTCEAFLENLKGQKGTPKKVQFILSAPAATLEIFTAGFGKATDFVRFGLWDMAFDFATKNKLLNSATAAEADVFCGADSERFHFRITDKGAAGDGKRMLEWWTEQESPSAPTAFKDLDKPANRKLTLVEKPAGSGIFESPGVMLVTDKSDTTASTPSGFGDGASFSVGQNGYRLRLGNIEGRVLAKYASVGKVDVLRTATVFRRTTSAGSDERLRVPMQIFALRSMVTGGRPDRSKIADFIFTTELRYLRMVYERIGLILEPMVDTAMVPAADRVTNPSNPKEVFALIDPPASYSATVGMTDADADAFVASHHGFNRAGARVQPCESIRLFYVDKFKSGSVGVHYDGAAHAGACFSPGPLTSTSSAAHELGHAFGLHHFGGDAMPVTDYSPRFCAFQNVMIFQNQGSRGIHHSGRLWDVAAAEKQIDIIRKSVFVRNF